MTFFLQNDIFLQNVIFFSEMSFFHQKSKYRPPLPKKKSPPDIEISCCFWKVTLNGGSRALNSQIWETSKNTTKWPKSDIFMSLISSILVHICTIFDGAFSFDASRCALSESVLRIAIWSHLISFHCDLVVHKIFRTKTSLVVAGLRPIQSDSQAMGPI